jgi:hypothetical protein
MSSVTINGHTYSDDGTGARDMLNGGHEQWLIPLVSDVVVETADTAADAAAAAASATLANTYALALRATSSTSLSIGTGAKVFTIAAGKQFLANDLVMVTRSGGAQWMYALVTSYASTTLTLSVQQVSGSGTFTDWVIGPCGVPGSAGSVYSMVQIALAGSYTAVAADKGKAIIGTGTLNLSAFATLANGWFSYVKASAGDVTIDPSGAETINGASTYVVKSGNTALIQGNGTSGTVVFDQVSSFRKIPIFSSQAATRSPVSSGEFLTEKYVDSLIGNLNQSGFVSDGVKVVVTSDVSSSSVSTTSDGDTYVLRTMPSSQVWRVNKNTGGWVAVAKNGTATANSADAITWASATSLGSAGDGSPRSVGAARVAVMRQTYTSVDYSDNNGSTWTNAALPATSLSSGLFALAGLFSFFTNSTTYYTSATAAAGSWTSQTSPITPNRIAVGVNGEIFICNTTTRSKLYYSLDLINWVDIGIQCLTGNGSAVAPVGIINGVLFFAGTGFVATVHNQVLVARSLQIPHVGGLDSGAVINNSLLFPAVSNLGTESLVGKIPLLTKMGFFEG